MILLDTSYIISLLNKGDVHHSEAAKRMHGIREDEVVATHPLVVQESVTVIAKKCREQSGECSEWLTRVDDFMDGLRIVETLPPHDKVIELMKTADCKLSYVDAALVLLSNLTRAPVLTFDKVLKLFCEVDSN